MEKTIEIPDDATRPSAQKIDGVTSQQRRHGRRLALFHEMHLREMSRVNRAMSQVFAGDGTAEGLLVTINSMQMVSNMRQLGNLCGATCQMLTSHHSIEDHYVFPSLLGHSEGLNRVVERLQAEHRIIHDLLERLEGAAVAMIKNPGTQTANALRSAFKQLERFVISHFGYEQTELEEALGFYGVEI